MRNDHLIQEAYTIILQHFIEHGRAPHFTELASILGTSTEEARVLQYAAAKASVGCWITSDTDYIGSWAPFSNVPTQYLITIDDLQKWYGQ